MSALASPVDLEARLGRELTPAEQERVEALLGDASALVRSYTGQTFAHVEDDVVVLRAVGGVIVLPQRPVTAVTRVEVIGGSEALPDFTTSDWLFDGIDSIRIGDGGTIINLPEAWWDDDGYPGTYRVTYSHGYQQVPGDVVAVVCGMVNRTLTAPTMAGGVTSETIGSYSYRIESPGMGLAVALSDEDRKILARYRSTATTVKVRR